VLDHGVAFSYRPGDLFNPIDGTWRQCDFGNLPVPTLIDPVVYSCPLPSSRVLNLTGLPTMACLTSSMRFHQERYFTPGW